MLCNVEVSNYKSIASCDLNLNRENVIVGLNGVGKSNLLDAIHFVRDAARDGLDAAITKRHGVNSIRRWSKTRPYNIVIKLKFKSKEGSGSYSFTISSARGDYAVIDENGSWFGNHPFGKGPEAGGGGDGERVKVSFSRNAEGVTTFDLPESPFDSLKRPVVPHSELLLSQLGQTSFSIWSLFFSDLFKEVVSFGAYSIYPNKIREPQAISNLEMLSDDGSNLASIVRQMRNQGQKRNRESLNFALRQVLPILSEIRIDSAGGFYVPVFRIKEIDSGYIHNLNMSQVSDGTIRMLGMLTAFYQHHAPTKIAIEEPEQMIHPGLLPVLLEAARDYLDGEDTSNQVIMTTHSPAFLDLFSPSNVIGAMFENGVSRFSRISSRQLEVIKSGLYTAGELMIAEGISSS